MSSDLIQTSSLALYVETKVRGSFCRQFQPALDMLDVLLYAFGNFRSESSNELLIQMICFNCTFTIRSNNKKVAASPRSCSHRLDPKNKTPKDDQCRTSSATEQGKNRQNASARKRSEVLPRGRLVYAKTSSSSGQKGERVPPQEEDSSNTKQVPRITTSGCRHLELPTPRLRGTQGVDFRWGVRFSLYTRFLTPRRNRL